MASRKLSGGQSQAMPAFLVAPKLQGNGVDKKDGDLAPNCKLQQGKTLKTIHRRLTSDCPSSKTKSRNPFAHIAKSHKSEARSNSPALHFKDLSQMFDYLSKKLTKGSPKWSPYSNSPKERSPRLSGSPKERKSLKALSPKVQSPRCSLPAPTSRLELKSEDGILKAPKLYDHQIFRDVFDEAGNQERVLYSSGEDSSLDIYHTVGSHCGKLTLIPKETISPTNDKQGLVRHWEERRESFKEAPQLQLGEELLRKLRDLQDKGDRSQSDTACEECRDSRKQSQKSHDSSLPDT